MKRLASKPPTLTPVIARKNTKLLLSRKLIKLYNKKYFVHEVVYGAKVSFFGIV